MAIYSEENYYSTRLLNVEQFFCDRQELNQITNMQAGNDLQCVVNAQLNLTNYQSN